MKKLWRAWRRLFANISLVDRFLMLFMLILLAQTAYNLFSGRTATDELNAIDVIVRTSAAAIFGYFLSGSFTKTALPAAESVMPLNQAGADVPAAPVSADTIQNRIGFDVTDANQNAPAAPPVMDDGLSEQPVVSCSRLRVTVVSIIGLSALIMLLILRNLKSVLPEDAATLSQLRDFVSAGVGFLISCRKSDDAG